MDIIKIKKQNRRWYQIILWWEIRRIPFNVIMYFVGLASFYIGYVTIPLVYIIIGLLINIGYSLGWIIELVLIQGMDSRIKMKYPAIAFYFFTAVSACLIIGFAIHLL